MRSRQAVLLAGLLLPIIGAAALCALASIWPVRFDARSLQDLSRVQGLGLPQSSGEFIFLSRDNSIESARTATFGLRQLAFPDGSMFWAALKEHCTGPWSSGFAAIDPTGNAFLISGGARGEWQWAPADEHANEARSRLATSFVVYDSYQTRKLFEERWPNLKAVSKIAVLTDSSTGSPFKLRRPASEFTLQRIAKIAAVIGSFLSVLLALIQFPSLRRVDSWLILPTAIFLSLGLNISLAYLFQWVAPVFIHWTPALLWVGGLLLVVLTESKAGVAQTQGISFTWPSSLSVRLMLLYVVAIYALLFLVRLDFDGDFFNNWLPQARFHYLLGKHDPAVIITQGAIHAASYPPGYGIVLSTLMWASGMTPTESFLIGPESSFAILLYRLFIFALNAALLTLVAVYLRHLRVGQPAVWMAFVAVILLLFPSTAGKHLASETVLFPMLAAAIVLIAAGQNLKAPAMTTIGIVVGGMATLIKWEAMLIFALAVLPWIGARSLSSTARTSRATKLKWAAALTLSLIPVIVWRATLTVHNDFFVPVTWARFVSSAHLLPSLAGRVVRGMLEDGRMLLLLLALPCAVVFHFLSSRWTALLVPFGIIILMTGFVVIYLFTNMDPNTHLDTSYSRLVMVPIFGAMLYSAEAIGVRSTAARAVISPEWLER